MMKPIFGKEDFTKKVKRIENLNSQTTKSSTNQRIITISPNRDRDNKCKKSNEHYNNIQNMHNPIKKTHTKKSSISPLLIENPINLNNYLNDKKSVKTTSTEKLKKNNNSGGVNSTFSTFVNKVSKNKRQNTEAFGLFVNNLNYNPESRHDVVYKKEQGKSKVINNQKQYETNTHDKNVLIDSIDDVIDTDMLGVYDAIQTHQNNNNKIYQNHHDVSYQIKQNREKSNKKKNGNNTSTTNNTSSILIKNQDVDENTNEKINMLKVILEDLITTSSDKKQLMGTLDNIYNDIIHTYVDVNDNLSHSPEKHEKHINTTSKPSSSSKIYEKSSQKQSPDHYNINNNSTILELKKDNMNFKIRMSTIEQSSLKLISENSELKKQLIQQNNAMNDLQNQMKEIKSLIIGNSSNSSNVNNNVNNKPKSLKQDVNDIAKVLNMQVKKTVVSSSKIVQVDKESNRDRVQTTTMNTITLKNDERAEKALQQFNSPQSHGLLSTEEKVTADNQNSDCLSINSSLADIEDTNLYYNFNQFKNSGRATEVSVKNNNQINIPGGIPTLNFLNKDRNDNKEKEYIEQKDKQCPAIKKKTFVSERDTKIKELNKANHNVDNERKTLDTEYSFSEEYREPIEETKVNNNTKNNQTTKFSLNMNKKSNNDNTATNDEAAASVQVLNFECLKRNDFNDEFVQNYEDFSPSWRKECDRLNLRKKNY